MPANKVKMIVYETSDGEYRVQPPAVQLDFADGGGPEVFVLRNHTKEDLIVYVGPGAFAATVAEPLAKLNGRLAKAVASQGAGTVTSYSLQVFGTVSGKKAKGNSDPVIIVEN